MFAPGEESPIVFSRAANAFMESLQSQKIFGNTKSSILFTDPP